ncbi:MAG: oxidoreductase [Desulfobulbus sp.]|nr:MAG: oxidoreductase [Desulfobulbus sp.]
MPTSPSAIHLVLLAILLFFAGAVLPMACGRRQRLAHVMGMAGALAGALAGLPAALLFLLTGQTEHVQPVWPGTGLQFALSVDALAAFFLLPVFLLVFCCALYAHRYLDLPSRGGRAARHWFFFNVLAASMALVVGAANSFVFLVAWEVMSLSSFFLVVHDLGDEQARRAGWLYLVATHLGTAFLFGLFLAEYRLAGSLDFSSFEVLRGLPPSGALVFFALALIGFGTKAGMFPLHCWLPEAHAAAPSHVSALMSGVMIKTALYGLLRICTFLPPLPAWCGLLLAGLGISGSLYGIALAALQPDLKKSLAYSTVENIGIILLGIGLWLYCGATGHPGAAALCLAGALLHVWNHALFKSLLFLGAGSILHATGTRTISKLGGLLRRMPVTGILLLAGGAAIAALPPLNGFVSELLIYLGLIKAGLAAAGGQAFVFMLFAALLALTGGMVLLAVTRLLGITLGGEPLSEMSARAHESSPSMLAAMAIPALVCLGIGIAPQVPLALLAKPMAILAPGSPNPAAVIPLPFNADWSLVALLLTAITVFGLFLRRRSRPQPGQTTWGCGFSRPSARMAYTAGGYSQFAQDEIYGRGPQPKVEQPDRLGFFPALRRFHREFRDPVLARWFSPLFIRCAGLAHTCHRLQAGQMNIYLTYIFLATVLLLGWSFLW